jgi:ABC-type nitrate/sulfonate/bicarbonate transport system substrate-binding protein
MGTEVAVTRGVGKVVLDIRRGDGPTGCFNYTMASIATTDVIIEKEPEVAAAAVRAIVATQKALKGDVSLATQVGRALFPEQEALLIERLIERDLPYYNAAITPEFVSGMNQFSREVGILKDDPSFESVVATQFSKFWTA